MIFKSIRLYNFRQYKDDISFSFSEPLDNKNNITLLIAANGVGKTTMLQAFRYCFYGKSSNYLNLPKADELVNNTLVEDLRDLDEAKMFVEVSFSHEGETYLARRETNFMKSKSLLKETNEEKFSLSVLSENEGYKPFKESEANEKIRSILPEGLSQVFMFDGERMERNISDRAFSKELKESILGILDIKKYDKLIDILGSAGKVTSVIGMLSNKKRTNTMEETKAKNHHVRFLTEKNELKEDIEEINQEIEEINQKIDINTEQQKLLETNRERVIKINRLKDEIESEEINLNQLASEYIKTSKYALLYKMMLINKSKYDNFVNLGRNKNNFYAFLHIDTIHDIQEKGVCVCGRPVSENSDEYKNLDKLKKVALPIESAQNLNLIDQKFKQSADYNEIMKKLTELKNTMRNKKKLINDMVEESNLIAQDILKVERHLGLTNQIVIEELTEKKMSLIEEKGRKEYKKSLCEEGLRKIHKKIESIDKNSEYNQNINRVIDIVQSIKDKLDKTKNSKDLIARETLSENFNSSLSSTLNGIYNVTLDSKYQIKITDEGNSKDVTAALSTGQNVVVSLAFINALIETAKSLSKKINKKEKYGVIMDAALSNLDEVHIERLCRNTINNMDQLIFLSFKRQLRNEMYLGIEDNIGKAYVLDKHNSGYIIKNDVDLATLKEYIHEVEED